MFSRFATAASPFTWTQGESLDELVRPERVAEIRADYERNEVHLSIDPPKPGPLPIYRTALSGNP
jgi:hypothetical protein